MITFKKAEPKDLNEIMGVISDIELKYQEESKNKIIDRISKNQLLCCLADNVIIGFLGWDTKFNTNSEYWYLEQITIKKDYRNKGIGQNFVNYFLHICHDKKIKKLYAHVQEHNNPSLKMFLNVGGIINKDPEKNVPNEITLEFNFI